MSDQEVKPEKKAKKVKANGEANPAPVDGQETATVPAVRSSKKFAQDAVITIVSEKNPKRAGSKAAGDWEKYVNGMTVKEARDAGISQADLLYNSAAKFITIAGYDAPAPRKQKRKAKEKAPEAVPAAESEAAAVA